MSDQEKSGDRHAASLHLFTDDHDYYAAETLAEALELRRQHAGTERATDCDLHQVGDGTALRVWLDASGAVSEHYSEEGRLTTKTAEEWAACLGKGFVFTVEH